MLVLTRQSGQFIEISRGGEIIQIHVIKIKSKQVSLGCEAPMAFKIHRHEIAERIRAGIPATKKVPSG